MSGNKGKVFITLLVLLIIVLSSWLITQFANNLAITAETHYTTYSGAVPVSSTVTHGVTPTPGASSTAPVTPSKPTPPPVSSPGTPTTDEQQIEQDVFQAINNDRASAGLPALQWSTALLAGAHQHNLRMSAADDMSHQLPGEPGIADRITADGVKWTWCGENIGWTSRTNSTGALGLHNSMMAEQPPDDAHRKNILSTEFTMVGVDIYIDSTHKLWMTEDFAN